MADGSDPIARMALQLARLPGIGQKSAQRLAYHIAGLPLDQVKDLAAALWQGRKALRFCARCGNYTQGEYCAVCENESRHNGQICVVRDARDVAAILKGNDCGGRGTSCADQLARALEAAMAAG